MFKLLHNVNILIITFSPFCYICYPFCCCVCWWSPWTSCHVVSFIWWILYFVILYRKFEFELDSLYSITRIVKDMNVSLFPQISVEYLGRLGYITLVGIKSTTERNGSQLLLPILSWTMIAQSFITYATYMVW